MAGPEKTTIGPCGRCRSRAASARSRRKSCAAIWLAIETDDARLPFAGDHGQPVSARYISARSEEHTSELQSLMRISYAVFCLKKKHKTNTNTTHKQT